MACNEGRNDAGRLHHFRVVDLGEELDADTEDVDPSVYGGQGRPLAVDRLFPSPRLRVIDDVIM